MARLHENPMVIASLLDRLTDENPSLTKEAVPLRLHSVDQLRASVARDLEMLLNTRREYLDKLPEQYAEVAQSLLLYGLPDFSKGSLKNGPVRDRVCQEIKEAIVKFEPRLRDVQVPTIKKEEATKDLEEKKNLHFRVDGMLRVDPAPEPVTFDTVFQLSTREYEVREES